MMQEKDRWLVLGGCGFIGSHTVEELLERGESCLVIDDLSSGRAGHLPRDPRVELIVDDAGSERVMERLATERFAAILHLAGSAYVPPSVDDPAMDFDANLALPLRLLLEIRRLKLHTPFILASSAAVYGDPKRNPIVDDAPVDPISPYGVSKLAAEQYLKVFARLYGLPAAALRLFSVYGPRQRKQVVYDLIQKTRRDPTEVEIIGDGTQTRDLVYVGDIARAFVEIALRAPLRGETYNVATGKSVTTAELARAIARTLDVRPHFHFTGRVRPGDPQHWRGAPGRLNGLGIVAQTDLEDGLRETTEWVLSGAEEVYGTAAHATLAPLSIGTEDRVGAEARRDANPPFSGNRERQEGGGQ
jgi:UDP-glucose 4-epimerase